MNLKVLILMYTAFWWHDWMVTFFYGVEVDLPSNWHWHQPRTSTLQDSLRCFFCFFFPIVLDEEVWLHKVSDLDLICRSLEMNSEVVPCTTYERYSGSQGYCNQYTLASVHTEIKAHIMKSCIKSHATMARVWTCQHRELIVRGPNEHLSKKWTSIL